jgi:hypothetical protein
LVAALLVPRLQERLPIPFGPSVWVVWMVLALCDVAGWDYFDLARGFSCRRPRRHPDFR